MLSTHRPVAALLVATLMLATAGVHAQSAPPGSTPAPAAPAQPAPPSAPSPQAPPPAYVTPPPQPAYPHPPQQQAYPQQAYPQQGVPPQQGMPPQQGIPPQQQQAWRLPQRPSKGLMITGISILAGSYLVAMLVGGSLLDEDDGEYDGCRSCADVAPYLFIPLAGPFVAMSQTRDDGGLIVLGMVEMVGAALTIGGIVRYLNTKHAASLSEYSLDLGKRRSLAFDVGTGPRLTGPRMTLRF